LLYNQIEVNYGDLTHLKSTFSAAAMGIFSNGWIWLVSDDVGNLGILPTIGPSTLLVRSRTNMHYDPSLAVLGEDSARHAHATSAPQLPGGEWPSAPPRSPASGLGGGKPSFRPFDYQSRTIHTTRALSMFELPASTNNIHGEPSELAERQQRAKSNIMTVGKTLFPLFVVPVYEHAWMSAGYGVWGKEAWLREFWAVLDWSKVSNAYKTHINAIVR
jgi:Fe-Mn family superoxide dismutase